LAIFFNGCGYTTQGSYSPAYRTIFVKRIANDIDFIQEKARPLYRPYIETKLHNFIVKDMMQEGMFKVVNSAKDADLILNTVLKRYELTPLRFNDQDDVTESRASIVVSLDLLHAHDQKVIWSEETFVSNESFFLTGSQAVTQESAVNDVIEDLSFRIVERVVDHL